MRGEADPNATVTVNENPTFRLGSYYFGSDLFDNTSDSGLANLETYATLSQPVQNGEGTEDLVSATTNQVYLAQSPETFACDDDGNQTLITTKTGLWRVTYNGENRPILWEQIEQSNNPNNRTILRMSYDHMGRRCAKNAQRFFYDGYLQVADNAGNAYAWDVTEPIATRPLVWTKNDISSYYDFDSNKNVSEVIAADGSMAAHYEYAPFGAVTTQRGVSAAANPWRFSSEFADDELGCDYYNYREYEPVTGRWMARDAAGELGGKNLYCCVNNAMAYRYDCLGMFFATDDVDSLWQMLVYPIILRSQHFIVANVGPIYEDAVGTLKEAFLDKISISCEVLPSGNVPINEHVRFGGRLFTNIFSSKWGPITYGFYTLGNAYVKGSIKYSSTSLGDVPVLGQCICCFDTTFTLNVTVTDRFDFIPDRKFWRAQSFMDGLSEFTYDFLAVHWSLFYNVYLKATRPTVEINVSETWSEILCAQKK